LWLRQPRSLLHEHFMLADRICVTFGVAFGVALANSLMAVDA
jgi:hypothetical protein